MATTHRHLAIFARFPAPGHVKTRLIPRLGREGASAFAFAALSDMLHLFSGELPSCRKILFFTPSASRPDLVEFLKYEGLADSWSIHPQVDSDDLGTRLHEAVAYLADTSGVEEEQAESGVTPVVTLMGMDCFDLTSEIVDSSMSFVSGRPHTAHMIGAVDGGYVLLTVPLSFHQNHVFSEIAWSCSTTGQEQKQKLEQSGLTCVMGEALFDVDEPEDLDTLLETLEQKRISYPRTVTFLDGLERI